MTLEQFNSYKFSKNTRVKFNQEWYKLLAVDFEERELTLWETEELISYKKVEEIKQV